MDKNTFAAYEYLPNNSPEAEADQFFVIQDDGTFMLNRQVQYVAEVQDVIEGIDGTQTCAVYDVNPPQFLVDVANNPGELISVADNYIMPAPVSEEVNNLYGNSFLLQTVGPETSVQAEKDMTITVQFNESEEQEEVDVVNILNKQGNTCTEITLSDEQYTSLEQKGWVLIENNGKIFILDAFGLHEVTTSTNNGLIQNLKDVSKIDLPEEVDSTGLVKDNESQPFNVENIVNTPLGQETVDTLKIKKKETEKEDLRENKQVLNKSEEIKELRILDETPDSANNASEKNTESRLQLEPQKYQSSKIKILTKYSFKDIPDKIVLGRTRNGKKLVAKVIKRTLSELRSENSNEAKPKDSTVEPAKTPEASIQEDSSTKATDIDDVEFEGLAQCAIRGNLESSPDEVVDASDVITQLFQVPEFCASVAGRNVVITRVRQKIMLGRSQRKISFVTGFVKSTENDGLLFIHIPHLLKKLTSEYDEYFLIQSTRSVLKKVPDCKILQVHIAETKHNSVQAISFILNERLLPCIKRTYPRRMNKLHACSACAAIFHSEGELSEHQAEHNHAMESEGALTIDTDKLPKDMQTYTIMESRYYVVKTSKGTEYCCFECPIRFNKLTNCTRHMKIFHPRGAQLKSNKDDDDRSSAELPFTNEDGDKVQQVQELVVLRDPLPEEAPYKCKMCPSAYYHPASLSKHINKAHIIHKVNMIQT